MSRVNYPLAVLGVFALLFGFSIVSALPVMSQTAVPVVVDTPAPQTFAEWLPVAMTAVLSGIGLFIGIAIRYLAKHLITLAPDMIRPFVVNWLDAKRQADLQKAITSVVSRIILEGRWTSASEVLDEIKDGVWASVGQAVNHFDLKKQGDATTDRVLTNIASGKAIEILKEHTSLSKVLGDDKLAQNLRGVLESGMNAGVDAFKAG